MFAAILRHRCGWRGGEEQGTASCASGLLRRAIFARGIHAGACDLHGRGVGPWARCCAFGAPPAAEPVAASGWTCGVGRCVRRRCARREVLEETGVAVCFGEARLAGVDVHPIPPNKREPLHLHHDLIFAFQAQNGEVVCSAESRDVVWCGLEDLDKYELPGSIRRSIKRAGFDAALNCIGVSG